MTKHKVSLFVETDSSHKIIIYSYHSIILRTIGLPLLFYLIVMLFDFLVFVIQPLLEQLRQLRMHAQDVTLDITVEITVVELSPLEILISALS